ncbi:putative RNA polymerase ECF subfamily sigma factor [metagenome]|uniref:Putative RNA polymerase ECF subfamily sigma factor n=1 Tax=metagenome TaxID=256318 RepID=A0A2P2CK12_9ZZZZ
MTTTDALLARTLREEAGPLVARLARRFRDFDLAEEAVQGAVVEALTSWRRTGPPQRAGAWLQVAATRNALDAMRLRDRQRALAARADPLADHGPGEDTDDRLALLFACCHPALAPEARLALTLRAVVGLTTPQIARAFLVNEATLAQRVVRAKRKVVSAGIALTVPPESQRAERLGDVLAVVYVMFNEGFVSSTGPTQDRDLAADAVWLAGVVATSLPDQAEAWGLAALLTIQHARSRSRFAAGELVLLRDQDRSLWDHDAISEGERMIERAASLRRPGAYQLQAAIAAVHATGASWAETDWLQISLLYDELARYDASPVVRLNQLVAHAQVAGPQDALRRLESLSAPLAGYHLFHATRAQLLTAVGRDDEAEAANRRALELTANDAERRLLTTRLHRRPLDDGS